MKIALLQSEDTERFGCHLGKRILLRPEWGRDVFLFGDVGVGKTTMLKGFSRGLGIEETINSPTFALVSEYQIPKNLAGLRIFSHLDIYRVDGDSVLALPEIFEKLEDETLVLALEWAEKLPKHILPENRIEIHFSVGTQNEGRDIELSFYDTSIPSDQEIRQILDECAVPVQIRKHTAVVTKVATFLAKKLMAKNYAVDVNLVRSSALLHNILWMCEYKNFSREQFPSDIDESTWNTWNNLYNQYKEMHYSEATSQFLKTKGHDSLADVILRHNSDSAPETLTLEEMCVFLGNYYVVGEKITSIAERLSESGTQTFESIFKAEREMCDMIGLLPEEVVAMEY